MKITEIQRQIEKIDSEILALLKRRVCAVQKLKEKKQKQGIDMYDPLREKELLNKLFAQNSEEKISNENISKIWEKFFELSRGKR